MNTIDSPKPHRVWPWIVGVILTPFAALGVTIASVIHLDRDAAALRHEFAAMAGGEWRAQVQLSVNQPIVSLVRTGLLLVRDLPPEARDALGAVHSASVGVYQATRSTRGWSGERLFAETDRGMGRLGWTRMVGVADGNDTVLIYVPSGSESAEPSRVCLAVCSGQQLVVVTARFDGAALAKLAARNIGKAKFAKL